MAGTVSGGLHGVGSSVVNALSTQLMFGFTRTVKFIFKNTVAARQRIWRLSVTDRNRTTSFILHQTQKSSETVEFDFEKLNKRVQELAFLNRGLRISITDKRKVWSKQKITIMRVGLLAMSSISMKIKMLSLKIRFIQTEKWMILLLK